MKKKIIYSSVLVTLMSASSIALAGGPEIVPEPDYFNGFYVGGIGGVHHNLFNGSSQVNLTDPISLNFLDVGLFVLAEPETLVNNDIGGGQFDGYGGVQGGYGTVFNHEFYVGLQGFGEWGTSSETASNTISGALNNIPIIFPDEVSNAVGSLNSSTTMKISNDYGISGKLGWVVAPRSMIYGKVGASWANIKVSNTTTGNISIQNPLSATTLNLSASSSNEQTQIGLLLGIGFEQFIYHDIISANVEFDHTNYGHVNTTTPNLAGNFIVGSNNNPLSPFVPGTYTATSNFNGQSSVRVITSALMAGLNFYFHSNWV